MPLRLLNEEFVREPLRREVPELRSRRARHMKTDQVEVRVDARTGVREDAREDSRGGLTDS